MCGAPILESRGTKLPEQIANHLRHHIKIHKNIYTKSTVTELPIVANILLSGLGETEIDVELDNADEINDNNNQNTAAEISECKQFK